MQKRRQRFLVARQLGGLRFFIVIVIVVVCGCVTAPFAIVRRKLHAAVAVPTLGHASRIQRCIRRLTGGLDPHFADPVHRAVPSVSFVVRFTGRRHRVLFVESEIFTRRQVFHFFFKKRVVVQHLFDFLAQLQGGELQQADGLLQLWRECQVLRDAQ